MRVMVEHLQKMMMTHHGQLTYVQGRLHGLGVENTQTMTAVKRLGQRLYRQGVEQTAAHRCQTAARRRHVRHNAKKHQQVDHRLDEQEELSELVWDIHLVGNMGSA